MALHLKKKKRKKNGEQEILDSSLLIMSGYSLASVIFPAPSGFRA